MDCKCGCGQQVEEKPGGHRQRLFVDDAHKMRWHRQQQQNDQHEALLAELAELRTKVADQAHTIELIMPGNSVQRKSYTEVLSELIDLREKVHNQEKTIVGLEVEKAEMVSELSRLYHRLDVERRFLEDKEKLPFKSWLKKQASPLKEKLCTDEHYAQLLPKGTRSHYEYRLRVHWHTISTGLERPRSGQRPRGRNAQQCGPPARLVSAHWPHPLRCGSVAAL